MPMARRVPAARPMAVGPIAPGDSMSGALPCIPILPPPHRHISRSQHTRWPLPLLMGHNTPFHGRRSRAHPTHRNCTTGPLAWSPTTPHSHQSLDVQRRGGSHPVLTPAASGGVVRQSHGSQWVASQDAPCFLPPMQVPLASQSGSTKGPCHHSQWARVAPDLRVYLVGLQAQGAPRQIKRGAWPGIHHR